MANLALAFDILARDKGATKTFSKIGRSVDDVGKKGSRLGSGLGKAAAGISAAFAGVQIGGFFKGAAQEAAESAKIARVTEQTIIATGAAAKVSADQVGELATSLSNKTAVDDELVQTGANLLLTFKNIRNEAGKNNDIFNQATAAALDLSAGGFGSVESASVMLGKALNDPIKGVTALGRVGVTFTQQQKDQIKALVANNDVLGAQKVILGEVQGQVGGLAEASADPMQRLGVMWGNLKEQIGGGVLPVAEKLARFATSTLLPAIATVTQILFKGDFGGTNSPWAEDSPVVAGLFKVRDVLMTLIGYGRQVVGILFQGDFTGGPWAEDSPTVAGLFAVREGFFKLVEIIRNDVWPVLQDVGGFVTDKIVPALAGMAKFVARNMDFFGPFAGTILVLVGALKVWTMAQAALNVVMAMNPIGLVVIAIAALVAAFVWAWKNSETFRNVVIGVFNGVRSAAGWVVDAFNWIVATIASIPGRIGDVFGGLWVSFKNAINRIIWMWNNLYFEIGGGNFFGLQVPRFRLDTPNIPYLARGGIVPATPGGRLAVIGEGGHDEAVIPLSGPHARGIGGGVTIVVQGPTDPAGAARAVRDELLKLKRSGMSLGLS